MFENKLFRIPDYQRGYAWRSDDDKEVVAFWNDLMNLSDKKSHFTGSITLQEVLDHRVLDNDRWLVEKGFKPWFVVDGQQRLTTIAILLQCIYEFLGNLPKDEYFSDQTVEDVMREIKQKYICRENKKEQITTYFLGYVSNDTCDNYLKKEIFGDKATVCSDASYYTLNMGNAKNFFTDNLNRLYEKSNKDLTVIEGVYSKVTQYLKFDLIEVKNNDDFNIYVAFETINNRGRQLSNLEKLKNRLVYLSTLYFDQFSTINPTKDRINKVWKEIYKQLGRNTKKTATGKLSVLDDDEFLKTHWILYYQYSRQTGNDYIKYLLDTKFTVQNVRDNLASTKSTQVMLHDDEDVEYIEDVENKENANSHGLTLLDINDYIMDLQNAVEPWYYTYFPQDAEKLTEEEILWIERINRLGIAYFRPLLTALLCKVMKGDVTHEKSVELLKAIERFIFIEFRMQMTRSHYGSSEFNKAARELHHGNMKVDDIVKMLEERINRSFETGADGQKYFKTQNMQVMVNKLFEQKDDERTGYYRWSAIHYLLYEYNLYLGKGYHGSNVSWDSFKQSENDKISIEHIFPHKATDGYWLEKFQSVPQENWPIYEGSLGNLLLLSQSINAKLQNVDFKTKKDPKDTPDRVGYKNGSYSEQEVAEKSDWTPVEIEQRGMAMMKFMEERWNFKFESEDCKKKLLFPTL